MEYSCSENSLLSDMEASLWRFVGLGLVLSTTLLLGCPTYTDEGSGTFCERADPSSSEVRGIEIFRFGGNIKALLRTYRKTSAADEEKRCTELQETVCEWTETNQEFNQDEETFEIRLPATARRGPVNIRGRFDSETQVSLTFPGEDAPHVFDRVEGSPSSRCDSAGDYLIRADFSSPNNRMPQGADYTIRRPVFALLWLGAEPEPIGDVIVWVAINRAEPGYYLDATHFDTSTRDALQGKLSLSVPAPRDTQLVRSGNTRFALAHFVVIDDREGCPDDPETTCPSEDRFSWNIGQEPLIGTSVELGLPSEAPEGVRNAEGWGRALFFVEGSLNDLDPVLRSSILNLEEIPPELDDQHFFLADIYFAQDEVTSMVLRTNLLERNVPIILTDDHLESSEIPLPRLFPISTN